jgi:hypothetical protein
MPYKRFRKTLFEKKKGKWTKKHTYRSANQAREQMLRMRKKEARKKAKEVGK